MQHQNHFLQQQLACPAISGIHKLLSSGSCARAPASVRTKASSVLARTSGPCTLHPEHTDKVLGFQCLGPIEIQAGFRDLGSTQVPRHS